MAIRTSCQVLTLFSAPHLSRLLTPSIPVCFTVLQSVLHSKFHTSTTLKVIKDISKENPDLTEHWDSFNKDVFPPQRPGEKPRPAYICHMMPNIKYSPKKLWYVAVLIRGMRIDDAINQLKFVHKKGAAALRQTLEEAQELAVKDHNVEFRSNLWVAESFVGKGMVIKGMRRHAMGRVGKVEYKYCHYFCRLEEGDPPEHYYHYTRPKTPQELLTEWLEEKRKRTIPNAI